MAPGFGGLACRGALRGRPPPPMGCLRYTCCVGDSNRDYWRFERRHVPRLIRTDFNNCICCRRYAGVLVAACLCLWLGARRRHLLGLVDPDRRWKLMGAWRTAHESLRVGSVRVVEHNRAGVEPSLGFAVEDVVGREKADADVVVFVMRCDA